MRYRFFWIGALVSILTFASACGPRGASDFDSLFPILAESEYNTSNTPHAAGVSGFARLRNISLSEAEARLQRHSIAAELAQILEERVAGLFGGLWISEDDRIQIGIAGYRNNGQTPVADSELDDVRRQILKIAAGFDVQNFVDIVEVRYSWNELQLRNGRISRLIFDGGFDLTTAIHTPTNSIIVSTPEYRSLSGKELELIESAKASSGSVTLGTYSTPYVKRDCPAGACHPPYPNLNPPLRGGVKLFKAAGAANVYVPSCTAGFIAKSKVDHIRYVITAGHCVSSKGQAWAAKTQNGSIEFIGNVHNYVNDGSDMAIIQIVRDTLPPDWQQSVFNWDPRKWVYVTVSEDTTLDASYPIHSFNTSVIGQRVCVSGASYKESSCGFVTKLGFSSNIGTNMGVANFCGVGGDSGSPVYSFHVAYGLQIGGSSECDSVYQGISEVQYRMNVNVVY